MNQKYAAAVVVRRRIAASPEELFDAWTDPEGMREWMCPGDVVSAEVHMDLRVGGSLLIIMRSPTQTHEHRCKLTALDRPRKIAFSWTAGNMPETHVTLEFMAVSATETELVLTHEGIPEKDIADRYQGGWGKIAALLEQQMNKRNAPGRESNPTFDIQHTITIEAPADQIYPLVARAKGFTSWWAEDVTVDPAGGAADLGFFGRATVYRLKALPVEPPHRVEWLCENGDQWAGTRLVFQLEPVANGTLLRFSHAGWRARTDYFVACNTTWGELMYRLKAAAEGKSRGPLFLAGSLAY